MWANEHPNETYKQPNDVGTGSYAGANYWTTKLWANAELLRISGNKAFEDSLHTLTYNRTKASLQSWSNNLLLEAFTIATNPSVFAKADIDTAKALIFYLADGYMASLENNGFGIPMAKGDFYWGSNGVAANKGMVLIHAYILTKDEKYLNAAIGIADYILGRNPLDLSYLTGFGVNKLCIRIIARARPTPSKLLFPGWLPVAPIPALTTPALAESITPTASPQLKLTMTTPAAMQVTKLPSTGTRLSHTW